MKTKRATFAYRCPVTLSALLLLAACSIPLPPGGSREATPSVLQPPSRSIATQPAEQAAATAHPLATEAALQILSNGGSPIDAAIAAQMVLGLVEPQSSGIGGGTLIMNYDAASGKLTSYDGLAAAPAKVTAALTIDVDGKNQKSDDVQRGGRSVGVPGTLAVLKDVHVRYGRLPWSALFEPAILLAERDFPMPRYMHNILATPTAAAEHPDLLPLFFGTDGKVLPIGTNITNPEYAATMKRIAMRGPAGLWEEGSGAKLIAAAQRGAHHPLMTEADLAAYRAYPREPLCRPFLAHTVCAMGPTSFGGSNSKFKKCPQASMPKCPPYRV